MLVERLRKEWRAREHATSVSHAPIFTSDGLVMGAGTVLVPALANRCLRDIAHQETHVLALLSAAYGREVRPLVLDAIERAARRWEEGEDCLALIHLALAGLGQPDDRREAARRLFMADGLIKAGIAPEAILQVFRSDTDDTLVRYVESQPRVPAGRGATSGQWTRVAGVLEGLTATAARFLARMAIARLGGLAENPIALVAGLLLIPRTTNLKVQGDVPEIPGLRYAWSRDEAELHLTYAGPNGSRDITATLEPDGQFHDGNKVIARLLPDETLAIDPAAVSSDLADKDGPNLCPDPELDKPGRGPVAGAKDKDYEDQIKLLVNPDNPTPRGYGYKFWDPDESRWVFIDDCQHRTGMRVEIKGLYEILAYGWGRTSLTNDWLDQSARQLDVSKGFELTWVFERQSDADFAANLFSMDDDERKRINVISIPRVGASQ